jgi:tRNA(adenine34) deaminase
MDEKENFMREALKEAEKAFKKGEVPVGAVIVYNGEIIARAHNEVETQQDASAHAEMLCLKAAARYLGSWRLTGATLYCTLEPCSMCAGAMLLSRIETLVWGAKDLRHGADGSFIDLLSRKHPTHQLKVVPHVLQEESSALMKSFFQERRRENERQEELFDELVHTQQERLLKCAKRIVPQVIQDDLLQPNDFPALENHPHFRYEEGVLEGLLTARMAYLAKKADKS